MPASDRPANAPPAPAARPPAPRAAGAAGADSPHPLWMTLLLAVAHGLLFVAAFPPVGLWPLVVLAPVPLVWLASGARRSRTALGVVFVVQTLVWLLVHRWVAAVTGPGYVAFAVYMALYAVAFVWILRRIRRHPVTRRWPSALVVPVVWVGLETLRGEIVFTGYPWYQLAHPLIEWPLLVQIADIGGAPLVSLIAAATAGAVVDLGRSEWGGRRARAVPAAIVAGLWAITIGYGTWRLGQTTSAASGARALRVLVVQTNLPQNNKLGWSRDEQDRDLASFIALTRAAFAAATADDERAPPDIIVWPETMLPGVGLEPDTMDAVAEFADYEYLRRWPASVRSLAADLAAPILVGSTAWVGGRVEAAPDRPDYVTLKRDFVFNSAYLIDGRPPYERYDKMKLTPFGEVMPYLSALPALEKLLMGFGADGMAFNLDAGESIRRLRLRARDGDVTIATPICFEDALGSLCREMVQPRGEKVVSVLINLSNDGWFAACDGGRLHHAQLARFRAIENRVPLVRCANTGASIVVDAAGRIVGRIGEGRYGTPRVEGWLDATVRLDSRRSPYGLLGDVPAWTVLGLAVGLLGVTLFPPRRGSGPKRGA